MIRLFYFLLIAILLPLHAIAAPLKLCFEDVPQRPWTYPDGSGLNLDLLHMVEKKSHDQFEFYSKPWKRCLEEVRSGQMDGIVGAADTIERRTYGVFPTHRDGSQNKSQALFDDSYEVFLRKGSNARWNGGKLSFTSPKGVLTQRGYSIGDELGKQGIVYSDTASSAEDALRQLSMGMFDVSILQGAEAKRFFRNNPPLREMIDRVDPPYVVVPFFLMIGKQTYARDPARIKAIWQAIAEMRASDNYRQLEKAAIAK